MRIEWTRRAARDLQELREYIARDNPRAAEAVARGILDAVERLAEFPASGRPGRKADTRELVVAGTPSVIPYRFTAGSVEILAVLHGARGPRGE
jgi:toxin ParE1/3/4